MDRDAEYGNKSGSGKNEREKEKKGVVLRKVLELTDEQEWGEILPQQLGLQSLP